MAYKILYIEDEKNFGSTVSELEQGNDFEVEVWSPDNLEEVVEKANGKDALIVDFRLAHSKTIVDGPAFAQTFRTRKSDTHRDIPIILFSVETNIIDYYKDYTSRDLFDFSIPKGDFLSSSKKYKTRIKSAIESYKKIAESKNNLSKILGTTQDFINNKLDYRIQFTLNNAIFSEDIYAFSNFIYKNLVQSIGVLIGEDVLSARLGISKDSADWGRLLVQLEVCKYTGIFSESYNRWWMISISDWFNGKFNGKVSLRRMTALQRCDEIKKITGLTELMPLEKINQKGYVAQSSNFWTMCKSTKLAIDPIDGFEIYDRDLHPWQDREYISFLGISSDYASFLKPFDIERIKEIEKFLKK